MTASGSSVLSNKAHQRLLKGGILALALGLAVSLFDPEAFLQSYLVAFLFWSGISLGGMIVLMVFHLTGGNWGRVLQPCLQANLVTVNLIPLLFLPILLGVGQLYAWAGSGGEAIPAVGTHKSLYLDTPFFIGRSLLYFALWFLLALCLNRNSGRELLPRTSAIGIVIYVLTVSFASVDWIMSLEAHWYSSIYGVLLISSQAVAGFSLALLLTYASPPSREGSTIELGMKERTDLGNLLLMLVLFWAYISFSQFLIIYYGNLPEETTWYIVRTSGGWGGISLALVFFHFILPFLLLLSRARKNSLSRMRWIAGLLLVMYLLSMLWLVLPSFHQRSWWVIPLTLWIIAGMGGIWLSVLLLRLERLRARGEKP